jgi:hypothetical protein
MLSLILLDSMLVNEPLNDRIDEPPQQVTNNSELLVCWHYLLESGRKIAPK